MIHSLTRDTVSGEDVLTFTDSGYHLWCDTEETNSRLQTDYGAPQTGADATIRIRNYPDVSAQDRLIDDFFGFVWIIESISYGDNEIIATASRFDDLEV